MYTTCMLTIAPAKDSFNVKGYNIICQSFWLYTEMRDIMLTLADLVPQYRYSFELQEKTYTVHAHIIFDIELPDTEKLSTFINEVLHIHSYTFKSPNYPAIYSAHRNKKFSQCIEHKFGYCICFQENFSNASDYLNKISDKKGNQHLQNELRNTYFSIKKSRDYKIKSKQTKRHREIYYETTFGHISPPDYSSDVFEYTNGICNQTINQSKTIWTPIDITNSSLEEL